MPPLHKAFWSTVDVFLPRTITEEQVRHRYRFLIVILLAILIYATALALIADYLPIRPQGRDLLVDFCQISGSGIFLGLALLRVTGSQLVCLYIFMFSLLVGAVNVIYHLGGIYAPASPVILFIPSLTMIILGIRAGLVWTLMIIGIYGAFYVAERQGVQFSSIMMTENAGFGIFMSLASTAMVLSFVTLAYELTVRRLNRELQQEHEQQVYLANHDSLTGLANRRHFIEAVEARIAAGNDVGFAILFIDINQFKAANDEHDHHFGDEVLIQVARRLQRATRKEDLVARWGGDEFAALLNGAEQEGTVLARIVDLHDLIQDPMRIRGIEYQARASIGYALYPVHGTNHEQLIHHADHQMYVKKRIGVMGSAELH